KTGREEDPDSGLGSQDLTELLPTSDTTPAYDQAVIVADGTDAATEVLSEVQSVTERLAEQQTTALLDDSGDTGEQPELPGLDGFGTDGPGDRGLQAPTTPYVLPAPSVLSEGPPSVARS